VQPFCRVLESTVCNLKHLRVFGFGLRVKVLMENYRNTRENDGKWELVQSKTFEQ
jgi:hypothetical protein